MSLAQQLQRFSYVVKQNRAQLLLPGSFSTVLKRPQYLSKQPAILKCFACVQLWQVALYGSAEIKTSFDFAMLTCYVILSSKSGYVNVLMSCAALLPQCVWYLRHCHCCAAVSSYRNLVYIGWTMLCA